MKETISSSASISFNATNNDISVIHAIIIADAKKRNF